MICDAGRGASCDASHDASCGASCDASHDAGCDAQQAMYQAASHDASYEMDYGFKLAPLDEDANKYTRGKLTLIAGSATYTGAAVLAACAAERAGAGYTQLVTDKEAVPFARIASPSLVVRSFEAWDVLELAADSKAHAHVQTQSHAHAQAQSHVQSDVQSHAQTQSHVRPRAVGLGCGFCGCSYERELTRNVLHYASCPVLIDATALSFLSDEDIFQNFASRAKRGFATVLTPHQGEARRLACALDEKRLDGSKCAHFQTLPSDEKLASLLARALHATVLLKGPVSYVSDGVKTVCMNEGTAALAKAGTGDVLAGIVASFLAQGVPALDAAYLGSLVHARAGKAAVRTCGSERSLIASDIIEQLGRALESL